MSHIIINTLKKKYRFCPTSLCAWGYNRSTNISTKHCNSRYKDKDCVTDVTFIRSIPVLHAENSVPMLFFSYHLYPQKGYQTHDLRFWRMWNWSWYGNELSERCVICGNFWETGWSEHGLHQACRYHLEPNWAVQNEFTMPRIFLSNGSQKKKKEKKKKPRHCACWEFLLAGLWV